MIIYFYILNYYESILSFFIIKIFFLVFILYFLSFGINNNTFMYLDYIISIINISNSYSIPNDISKIIYKLFIDKSASIIQ